LAEDWLLGFACAVAQVSGQERFETGVVAMTVPWRCNLSSRARHAFLQQQSGVLAQAILQIGSFATQASTGWAGRGPTSRAARAQIDSRALIRRF
jgi:hypothetical protein